MDEGGKGCVKCKQKVDNEDYYTCDFCCGCIHTQCYDLSASEVRCMSLKNRTLKLACGTCYENMCTLPKLCEMMEIMRQEMIEIKSMVAKQRVQENVSGSEKMKKSYSKVVESKTNKDVILVKPKTAQDNKVTINDLQQHIKPDELNVGISKMKKLRDGGIAISCNSKKEVTVLQKEVKNKLGKGYNTKIPELLNPRIKIVGLSGELSEEEIRQSIIKQNTFGTKLDMFKLKLQKLMKTKYMAIAEVNSGFFREVINEGKVNIGWDRCSVYEHFNVVRCYRCGRFNHFAADCKLEKRCFRCSSREHEGDCESIEQKCINCCEMNRELNLKLDVNHGLFDTNCPVYERMANHQRGRTNYATSS